MAFEIRLREEAVIEIEEALEYYLQISPQTAFSFDEDFLIAESLPEDSAIVYIRAITPLSPLPEAQREGR